MFYELLAGAVVIFSVGACVSMVICAVAFYTIADAKLKWVELKKEMFKKGMKRYVK